MAIFRNWRSVDLPEDEQAMLEFAEKLTLMSASTTRNDVERLREVGFSDENIYEAATAG